MILPHVKITKPLLEVDERTVWRIAEALSLWVAIGRLQPRSPATMQTSGTHQKDQQHESIDC